jgi:hypothetical protein
MNYKNESINPRSALAVRSNIGHSKVHLDECHAVYNVDLIDLMETNNLDKSEVVAWRHFGLSEDGTMGVYETNSREDDGEHQYAGFHYGGVLDEHLVVLKTLQEHPELIGSEHALLRINMLKLYAIWFKTEKKGSDYFYPLSPRFHGLEDRLYEEKEFLPIVIAAAKKLFGSKS